MRTPARVLWLIGLLLPAGMWPPDLRAEEEMDEAQAKEEEEDADVLGKGTFSGLKLRSIGPALMSGRLGCRASGARRQA